MQQKSPESLDVLWEQQDDIRAGAAVESADVPEAHWTNIVLKCFEQSPWRVLRDTVLARFFKRVSHKVWSIFWEAHQDGIQAEAVGESPVHEAPSTRAVLNDLRFEECVFSAVETAMDSHLVLNTSPLSLIIQDFKNGSFFAKSQIFHWARFYRHWSRSFFLHLRAGVVGTEVHFWWMFSSDSRVAGNSCASSKEGLQYNYQQDPVINVFSSWSS